MSEQYLVIRKEWAQSDAKRDAGLTTPPEIIRYDDIRYGDDPEWQCLDVYRPRGAAGRNFFARPVARVQQKNKKELA